MIHSDIVWNLSKRSLLTTVARKLADRAMSIFLEVSNLTLHRSQNLLNSVHVHVLDNALVLILVLAPVHSCPHARVHKNLINMERMKTFFLYANCLAYVSYGLHCQQLVGFAAGLVVIQVFA